MMQVQMAKRQMAKPLFHKELSPQDGLLRSNSVAFLPFSFLALFFERN